MKYYMHNLIMYTNSLYLVLLVASSLSASAIHNAGDSCSVDQWKCDDGTCMSIDGKWDGTIKCQNSSVPSNILNRKTRQAQNGNCILPEYPANGTYTTHIPNAKPGDAYDLVTINVTCDQGFALNGSSSAFCVKGWWSESIPYCVSQCYLPSHPSVEYRCLVSGLVQGSRVCDKYEINGTVVSPQCRSPNYYSATILTYMRCIDGNWDYIAKCSPECGTVSSSGTDLVIGGETAKRAEVPWHAAIYSKTTDPYKQICGGSLISNNIVLSAAHCFWSNFQRRQLPATEFAVAVGKLYRPWNNDKEDAQRSDVMALHLPPLFQGSAANNQEDIAVVVVATPFVYSTYIRPVCVDFDNFFQIRQLKVGNMGKVAGWGLTAVNGTPSQVLKVINLPYVSIETCINDSPPDFLEYITGDKICAGFKNEQKAVCKGDSGGGLAFPESEKGTLRYYLRGIVSTAPNPQSNDLCNVNFYTAFTQILRHEHFIKQFWENGVPCQLKPHHSVEYRCLSFGNVENYYRSCNEYEISGTVVSPKCRSPGYLSVTALTLMKCVEGKWDYIAQCSQEFPCKEESLGSKYENMPLYSTENETFNHVSVKRNSTGHLEYFEMYIAIQADRGVGIKTSDKGTFSESDILYYIHVGADNNQNTKLDLWLHSTWTFAVKRNHTPNILSSTQFRDFYVKIDNGILEFGKKGSGSPLISHKDARLSLVNYFSFFGYRGSKIRYDCPAPVKAIPCKEESFSKKYWFTPPYSMDNKTFNHVTLRKNSTGHLTYLETHIAIEANERVRFQLTDKGRVGDSDLVYDIEIGWEKNQFTQLSVWSNGEFTTVQRVPTPNILSSTQFTAFNIKIDNGKLEFGKEGENPLISHYDAGYSSVNYFKLIYFGYFDAKIRYDCPAPVEESS